MQLIISIVTPLDFSRKVEYSCVISLSAAATNGVLKKNAKPIAVTFLVHSRLFATSLLNFSIIVNSHLRTHHRCLAIEIVHPVPLCCQLRGEEIDTRRVASWSSGRKVKSCERSRCQRSTLSSTISARNLPCSAVMRPTVTGRRKRRGPALPGLKKSVPFFVSILGWCE